MRSVLSPNGTRLETVQLRDPTAPTGARAGFSADHRTLCPVLLNPLVGQRPYLTSDSFRAQSAALAIVETFRNHPQGPASLTDALNFGTKFGWRRPCLRCNRSEATWQSASFVPFGDGPYSYSRSPLAFAGADAPLPPKYKRPNTGKGQVGGYAARAFLCCVRSDGREALHAAEAPGECRRELPKDFPSNATLSQRGPLVKERRAKDPAAFPPPKPLRGQAASKSPR